MISSDSHESRSDAACARRATSGIDVLAVLNAAPHAAAICTPQTAALPDPNQQGHR